MPSLLDRETFTLLNLSDTGSESVPDLDLVQPTRTQNRRKVKYKRRERAPRSSQPAPPPSDWDSIRPCKCGSPPSACQLGGVVFMLTCLGSLLYLNFTLTDKLQALESRISSVDEVSRSAASPIIAIKTLLDDLQNNQTGVYKRLSELETRLTGLETSLVKISSKPQGEDVLQGLADLGGKLTEVQQTVEKLKKENIKNSADVIKLDSTINNLKLHDINKDGEQSPEKSKLPDFETSLSETKNLLNLLQDRFETVNTTLSLVAQNSTARMDWLSKDLSSVQVKISQLEDDNRNVSSRLLNIDGTMNAALAQVKTNLTSLAGVVNSWTPPSPEISPILKKVKLGPRDKK